ncbi:hypothetical protein RRG08_000777 [Elysia crispata]|uniref:Uncharacterized protein n=1 Tax=Elysia crispata TaxID=231223 RepID=A0AAE1DNX1_9GAST|nr:hypothetical protein RRG08_000777 [Elysia crispata]
MHTTDLWKRALSTHIGAGLSMPLRELEVPGSVNPTADTRNCSSSYLVIPDQLRSSSHCRLLVERCITPDHRLLPQT